MRYSYVTECDFYPYDNIFFCAPILPLSPILYSIYTRYVLKSSQCHFSYLPTVFRIKMLIEVKVFSHIHEYV